jgi:hypothetical protein
MTEFLKGVFSDNGSPSSSRVLTALHAGVACSCLVFVVHKTGSIPDAMTLAGLGTFAGVHYALNAARNVLQKSS